MGEVSQSDGGGIGVGGKVSGAFPSLQFPQGFISLGGLRAGRVPWGDLMPWKGPSVRRVALKELSFRMPFRSQLRFVYMYFWKLGFLDGRAGYHYCKLLSIYEYLIEMKMREMRHESGGAGSPLDGGVE